MTRCLVAVAVASLVLAFAPLSAQAADDPPAEESPSELAREGVDKLIQALDAFVRMIPQYEAPVLLENGDILIKRKWPEDEDPKGEEDDEEEIRT